MSDPALESTRRRLTAKQADTVDRLGRAAVEILTRDGFAGLTVRRVAAEAGVGAATAYTYFSSKEHLVAEVFWRKLAAAPPAVHDSDDSAGRVIDVLRHIALLVADEPEFAGAVTSALLGRDPDVEVLRLRIGRDIHDRLLAALGPTATRTSSSRWSCCTRARWCGRGWDTGPTRDIADRLEKSARLMLS